MIQLEIFDSQGFLREEDLEFSMKKSKKAPPFFLFSFIASTDRQTERFPRGSTPQAGKLLQSRPGAAPRPHRRAACAGNAIRREDEEGADAHERHDQGGPLQAASPREFAVGRERDRVLTQSSLLFDSDEEEEDEEESAGNEEAKREVVRPGNKPLTQQKRNRILEMEKERREAQKRKKERQFLQDVDKAKKLAKEFDEEQEKKEQEKKEKTEMKNLIDEQKIPAILHGGRAIYPFVDRSRNA